MFSDSSYLFIIYGDSLILEVFEMTSFDMSLASLLVLRLFHVRHILRQ